MLRRLLISTAFATCCFLNTWVALAEAEYTSFARYDPFRAVLIPVLCWEIVLAAVIMAVWELVRRRALAFPRTVSFLFLAACLAPFGIACLASLQLSPVNLVPLVRTKVFWVFASVLAAPALVVAIRKPIGTVRLVRGVLLSSWAVLAVVLIQAARHSLLKNPPSTYEDGAAAPVLPAAASRVRLVWIIFDELSQSITFDHRPESLQLPEFDRLQAETFHASSAHAPANSTEYSMPAIILGEMVTETHPRGPGDFRFRTTSRRELLTFDSAPNVFDDARQAGFNTALVGWFLPYGRILNRSLTRCYWTAGWLPSGIEEPTEPQTLPREMWRRASLQFVSLPLVGHLPGVVPWSYHRDEKRNRFLYLMEHACPIISDPSIGLALIHLPIPHPPAIYNRAEGAFTTNGRAGYLDSVALVDRTLGELRRAMEQAGVWKQTAVLVSADHGWRTNLWRGGPEWTPEEEAVCHMDTSGVPFLLKLPRQSTGIAYNQPFDTVVTRTIITEILAGRLSEPDQIGPLIERTSAAITASYGFRFNGELSGEQKQLSQKGHLRAER